MAKALIVSAGNNANEYLARHIGELGYTRPTIVASGGEARRRMVESPRGWPIATLFPPQPCVS